MSTRDEREQRDSERAWALGVTYGEQHRLADVQVRNANDSEDMYYDAMRMGCPIQFFDVFKYGAQSVWRERGELSEPRGRHRYR